MAHKDNTLLRMCVDERTVVTRARGEIVNKRRKEIKSVIHKMKKVD
jgi:hypothetical protein